MNASAHLARGWPWFCSCWSEANTLSVSMAARAWASVISSLPEAKYCAAEVSAPVVVGARVAPAVVVAAVAALRPRAVSLSASPSVSEVDARAFRRLLPPLELSLAL